jgi:hypothetical protein
MKYYQEVTEWNASFAVPNHIYYMNDAQTEAVGYIPVGKDQLIKFSKPMKIDKRGRKFIKLNRAAEKDSVYFGKKQEEPNAITVEGSGGKKYLITKSNGTYSCSCLGFSFRGKCKHVESLGA